MEEYSDNSDIDEDVEIALYSQIHFESAPDDIEFAGLCQIDRVGDANRRIKISDYTSTQPAVIDVVEEGVCAAESSSSDCEDKEELTSGVGFIIDKSNKFRQNFEEKITSSKSPVKKQNDVIETHPLLNSPLKKQNEFLELPPDTPEKQKVKTKEGGFIKLSTKKKKDKTKLAVSVKPRDPPVRLRRGQTVNVTYKQHSDTDTDTSGSGSDESEDDTLKKAGIKMVTKTVSDKLSQKMKKKAVVIPDKDKISEKKTISEHVKSQLSKQAEETNVQESNKINKENTRKTNIKSNASVKSIQKDGIKTEASLKTEKESTHSSINVKTSDCSDEDSDSDSIMVVDVVKQEKFYRDIKEEPYHDTVTVDSSSEEDVSDNQSDVIMDPADVKVERMISVKEESAEGFVTLDSTSEDEESSSSASSEGEDVDTTHVDTSLEFNLKVDVALLKARETGADSTENWHINHQDSNRIITSMNRYWAPKKINCRNCKEEGHMSRDCPLPLKKRCVFCAKDGHTHHTCPDSFCYNCDSPGHMAKDCKLPKRRFGRAICQRCLLPGHVETSCPDLWRQFSLTTETNSEINIVKVKTKQRPSDNVNYCYNCGEHGHLGYECEEERFNRFVPPSYPFIARYDDIDDPRTDLFSVMGFGGEHKAKRGKHKHDDWRKNRTHSKRDRSAGHEEPQVATAEERHKTKRGKRGKKKKDKYGDQSLNDEEDWGRGRAQSAAQHHNMPRSSQSYGRETSQHHQGYYEEEDDENVLYQQDFEEHQVSRNEWWNKKSKSARRSWSDHQGQMRMADTRRHFDDESPHRHQTQHRKRGRDEGPSPQRGHKRQKTHEDFTVNVRVTKMHTDAGFPRGGRGEEFQGGQKMRHSHSAPNLRTNDHGGGHGAGGFYKKGHNNDYHGGQRRNPSGFQSKNSHFANIARQVKRSNHR